MTGSEEKKAFEEALKRDPWDTVTRLVFADWLEERGLDDEANSQRRWVTAHLFMREFVKEHHTYAEYHKPPYEKEEPISEEKIREWYEQFLVFLEAHLEVGEDGVSEKYLSFDTPRDFNSYSEELWEHFEVLTGKEGPEGEWRHKQPYISCGC